MSVLSSTQIDQFVEDGYVMLTEAFSRGTADAIRNEVWSLSGLSPNEPETWTKPLIHLPKIIGGPVVEAAFTPRLNSALDDVMGVGRWNPIKTLGWWPISFPGFDAPPWQPPTKGWHIDGIQFHHHVNSADQGLLPIFLLSDIGPGDGGTAISVGSHKTCARILAESEPDGLDQATITVRMNEAPWGTVIEMTGQAGDVALIHPFVLHARSVNVGKKVRFICNPCFSLKEPMQFDRPDPSDLSPVERAIADALG